MIKFPNKLFSYHESVISKFPLIIEELGEYEISVTELYNRLKSHFSDIDDYIETLSCLFSLNRIELINSALKTKKYAERNNMR